MAFLLPSSLWIIISNHGHWIIQWRRNSVFYEIWFFCPLPASMLAMYDAISLPFLSTNKFIFVMSSVAKLDSRRVRIQCERHWIAHDLYAGETYGKEAETIGTWSIGTKTKNSESFVKPESMKLFDKGRRGVWNKPKLNHRSMIDVLLRCYSLWLNSFVSQIIK